VSPFARAARDAGRALGDCGAEEGSGLVEEIAELLAELEAEPTPPRRRARKSEIGISKLETNPKSE
jgi:hypothetical protein